MEAPVPDSLELSNLSINLDDSLLISMPRKFLVGMFGDLLEHSMKNAYYSLEILPSLLRHFSLTRGSSPLVIQNSLKPLLGADSEYSPKNLIINSIFATISSRKLLAALLSDQALKLVR